MANNPNHMKNLTPFSSTYQPATKGRKPSRWKKFCKDYDLSDIDRKFVAQVLLSKKSKEEIIALINDSKVPFGIWAACVAAMADARKGGGGFLTYLFDAGFGKMTDKIEHSGGFQLDLISPEERERRINELLTKRDRAPGDPDIKEDKPNEPEK